MGLTPCMDGLTPWTPPEDVTVEGDMFFGVVWTDAEGFSGWFGLSMCGTRLFYGFDGTVKIIRRVRMEWRGFGKKQRRKP